MKISLTWLKEFIDLPESTEQISQWLTGTGLEVEGVETYEEIEGGLEGLVIGEVVTCTKHANADKLSVTTVDIGNNTISPIVCGAPNVAVGQKVVVATVGATLYPSGGESFKIKKAKIRGEVSEGMICAEDEIGLGASHDGIMVLPTDLPNGTPAKKYFKPSIDEVVEIGLTPNRADAASHQGVARDLRALLDRPIILPESDASKVSKGRAIAVEVMNTTACPRYSGLTISGIKVEGSPSWLQNRLKAIGLSPINNVVDITNYILHGLGQPLHAFDADEITGDKIIVDTLTEGTTFTTLDEKERKLASSDLMICNADLEGMCIAGVFGGIKSGVKQSTTSIFLESACFAPDYIRKTAQNHQLKTDASFRFERGTDPNNTVFALKVAAKLITEICGGEITSDITDIYPRPVEDFVVSVKYKNIDRLIGKALDRDFIRKTLELLDIKVESKTELGFTAVVPPYRVDVTREADIIEEILRIHGYDNIELSSQLGSTYLSEFPDKDKTSIMGKVANLLVSRGYSEIFTNSLSNPTLTANTSDWPADQNIEVLNKLSEELGILRPTLLFTGLESIRYNISHKQSNLKFFELGKSYTLSDGKYKEKEHLVLFLSGKTQEEHWNATPEGVDFHNLKEAVVAVFHKLGIGNLDSQPSENETFQYALSLSSDGRQLASLGLVAPQLAKRSGLKTPVFFADIDWKALMKSAGKQPNYTPVSKHPEVRRDLSLVIDKKVSFKDIQEVALTVEKRLLKKINVFSVYEGEKIEEGKKSYALSFILQDQNKTLQDKAIDKVMQQLIKKFESDLNAHIRK